MPSQTPSHIKPSRKRNPWPIAIVIYFAVFISFLFIFATFATRQHVDLVQDDYYEQEIRFQEQFERVARTQALGDEVRVVYDAAHKCIVVSLPVAQQVRTSGQIHLYRPSDAKLDREIQLALDPQGYQRLDARLLKPGFWKVRVRWAVDTQEFYYDQPITIRAPSVPNRTAPES